ncbi:hypothetical protein PR202_gb12129 [Eleusine coracana subsp. coracana]|uniref:F-box domain-containing protein n=1 Tax=Eleusine coracana subsp. coracana TaxID=191504 RepID=A0AAV5EQM4_ELECO|nr:hypothetical protein PR202_gb12129 [Eleusine coracana subsp. coracana]
MATEAPSLMDELVEEILLRFPPDDPGSLLSAALVCKAWCRLVSGPGFHRRFREFHHQTSPPLLGFLCTIYDYESSGGAENPLRAHDYILPPPAPRCFHAQLVAPRRCPPWPHPLL